MALKKRSRSKGLKREGLHVMVSPEMAEVLEGILDQEEANGRKGFSMSALMREGLELVISRYSPNGSGAKPQPGPAPAVTPPTLPKPVIKIPSRGKGELPHAGDRDFLVLTNTKALGPECDGEYIKEVKGGAKKYICSMWLDGRCLRKVRPPNCPKLAHITPKEVEASLTGKARETTEEESQR